MQAVKSGQYSLQCFFLLLLMMSPAVGFAGPAFTVESASSKLDGSVYFLNAVFTIELPGYVEKAVEQGFELPLAMEIKVLENRKLWLDKEVVFIRQQYRIRYHLLLDAVSVLDVNAGSKRFYASLGEALEHLSVLINFPLLDNNPLSADKKYKAQLRFGVDSKELPVPLKSSSLWENNWALNSDWYEWVVNP